MNSQDIRQAFLDYFQERGHTFVPSSSLIPDDDPTLLFTNAGMNQFKRVLLGEEKRSYLRAANSQKCMRVSGKHNDLEAVGRDGRHHTFFEMLGNWSFGDYYKLEAIQWAWEFLTEKMGLEREKLLVSVYKDDDESYQIWRDRIGVPEDRIYRLGDISKGDEENFWSMGDTGPCGPCTEIHFDQGSEVAGGDERPLGENDSDRYLEIWNLVFIQYDRDSQGNLSPLPLQSVDTGMGLERLAALKAKVSSNYGTDLFQPLVRWVAKTSRRSPEDPEDKVSMQVIADHARALTFTVADGGRPGNDGRGYVLRRILRRAARHGRRLGFTEPFLYEVADLVIEMMGGHYRELVDARDHIMRVIRTEEERFNETLDRGLVLFDEASERASEEFAQRKKKGSKSSLEETPVISGEDAFKLHDTFGFPLDLTELMASEKGMRVDTEGFEEAMEAQRARARAASNFSAAQQNEAWNWLDGEPGVDRPAARFVGYEKLDTKCKLLGFRPVDQKRFEVVI
ncbi:MAG TPA: alanine--tRNA ligase, partial [Candidatus Krumholzibacteria bacterium]|nr:alanine--tRNA ligase [Candidatus Krumholzibacteria bacterium]